MIRVLLSSAVAVIVIASACGGQTPDSSRPGGLALLSIPEGQGIMCREPEVKRTDPRAAKLVVREFRFGTPTAPIISWPRETSVLFDSIGHPLLLSDVVKHVSGGSQGIVARLTPDGQVTGKSVLTTVDAEPPAVSRDLSPTEAAQVRPLGTWLWEHRCGRDRK